MFAAIADARADLPRDEAGAGIVPVARSRHLPGGRPKCVAWRSGHSFTALVPRMHASGPSLVDR